MLLLKLEDNKSKKVFHVNLRIPLTICPFPRIFCSFAGTQPRKAAWLLELMTEKWDCMTPTPASKRNSDCNVSDGVNFEFMNLDLHQNWPGKHLLRFWLWDWGLELRILFSKRFFRSWWFSPSDLWEALKLISSGYYMLNSQTNTRKAM